MISSCLLVVAYARWISGMVLSNQSEQRCDQKRGIAAKKVIEI